MPDGIRIVTMLADEAAFVPPGSTTDRCCVVCRRTVVLAPSSVKIPDFEAICLGCFREELAAHGGEMPEVGLTAPPEQMLREIAGAFLSGPSRWKTRN